MKSYDVVFIFIVSLLLVGPTWAQKAEVGDSIIVKEGSILRAQPNYDRPGFYVFSRVDTLKVLTVNDYYYEVTKDDTTGWLFASYFTSLTKKRRQERLAAQAAAREQRKIREEKEYEQSLRDQRFGLKLLSMYHDKNSADGVSVFFRIKNVDSERVMKYITFAVRPYNPVGDPVTGSARGRSLEKVRAVGPVRPGETGSWTFDNVWYAPSASCVEIKRITVEYVDGSSFTYVNDLTKIDKYGSGVRLNGECALE